MSVEVNHVDPLIGRVFASRYKIEEQLGAGAMGTVYKARHVKVGRPFAVKMLHERLLLDDKLRRRFDRETELAGKLHHINVVGVVDVGETEDGIHFMVMEFADGKPLGSLMTGPMPANRVIDLVQQLCDGLQHAHEHGLIHRDFKPDNVIVERDRFGTERPRIVDFGIAILRDDAVVAGRADRLTTAGLVLGTPHYMAPEHAMGGGIDHRIDLFALGVICYELLTGQLPYDGDGVDVARANLMLATPPMGIRVPGVAVDPLLEAFTRLLMQKDPAHRPQSAKEARKLLDLIATDRTAAAAALDVARGAARDAASAVSSVPGPAGGAAPVVSPVADRLAPAAAAPTNAPSTRAVRLPERRPDADRGAPDAHRASPRPGQAPRARTASGEHGRTPVVDGRLATGAALSVGSDASGAVNAGRAPRAATNPGRDRRAATEPGRNPRAATVLPHPRRLLGIGIGVGLVVLVVLVVVIAMRRSSSGSSAPPRAAAALPIDAGDVIDASAAQVITADAAVSPAGDAAAGSAAVPVVKPKQPKQQQQQQQPRQPKPKQPKQPKQQQQQPKQPKLEKPTAFDTSGSGVAQLYGTVGRELKALDARKGSAATSALWPRYLRIRINAELATPEKRAEAHRTLSVLRTEIAARR